MRASPKVVPGLERATTNLTNCNGELGVGSSNITLYIVWPYPVALWVAHTLQQLSILRMREVRGRENRESRIMVAQRLKTSNRTARCFAERCGLAGRHVARPAKSLTNASEQKSAGPGLGPPGLLLVSPYVDLSTPGETRIARVIGASINRSAAAAVADAASETSTAGIHGG